MLACNKIDLTQAVPGYWITIDRIAETGVKAQQNLVLVAALDEVVAARLFLCVVL